MRMIPDGESQETLEILGSRSSEEYSCQPPPLSVSWRQLLEVPGNTPPQITFSVSVKDSLGLEGMEGREIQALSLGVKIKALFR